MAKRFRRSASVVLALAGVAALVATPISFFSSGSVGVHRQVSHVPLPESFDSAADQSQVPRPEWRFMAKEAAARQFRTYVTRLATMDVGNGGLRIGLRQESGRGSTARDGSDAGERAVDWTMLSRRYDPRYPSLSNYRRSDSRQLLHSRLGLRYWRGPYEPDARAYGAEFVLPLPVFALLLGAYPLTLFRRRRRNRVGFPIEPAGRDTDARQAPVREERVGSVP